MNKGNLRDCLEDDARNYAKECAVSVARNSHMNRYTGETINENVARLWLITFVRFFAERYTGGTRSGEVMLAMRDVAKAYRTVEPRLPYAQTTADAILVDFINWVAGHRCGMDLALYTWDIGDMPSETSTNQAPAQGTETMNQFTRMLHLYELLPKMSSHHVVQMQRLLAEAQNPPPYGVSDGSINPETWRAFRNLVDAALNLQQAQLRMTECVRSLCKPAPEKV